MAQRTIVQLTDDLDGKPIPDGKGETIRFSLDRTDYEIDLTDKNAKALRDTLAKYVTAARRTGTGTRSAGRAAPAAAEPDRPGTADGTMTPRRSGPGPSPRGSRSASAAASPPTSSPSSRKPTPEHPTTPCDCARLVLCRRSRVGCDRLNVAGPDVISGGRRARQQAQSPTPICRSRSPDVGGPAAGKAPVPAPVAARVPRRQTSGRPVVGSGQAGVWTAGEGTLGGLLVDQ